MNLEKIRENIRKKVNHTRRFDRYPRIYKIRDTNKSCLDWEYNGHEIHVVSEDYTLISAVEDCIKIYLEETSDGE